MENVCEKLLVGKRVKYQRDFHVPILTCKLAQTESRGERGRERERETYGIQFLKLVPVGRERRARALGDPR